MITSDFWNLSFAVATGISIVDIAQSVVKLIIMAAIGL